MMIFVAGASGQTGKLLVQQLLNHGDSVKIVVRDRNSLPSTIKNHSKVHIIQANILDLSNNDLSKEVRGCDAIASCLGHNMSIKGLFGHPRQLVTDATRKLCNAVKENKPEKPTKFVLMNTAGKRNADINEKISLGQKIVVGLLRLLLPPHADNEKAADFLRTKIGQNNKDIEWVVVRPDNLINEEKVGKYNIYPSPIRSAIFNAGITSRINVGHFMAELITSNLWEKWKGQMPVIYNQNSVQNSNQ
ncbi:NAD(P)-dependent oxidoreductase [Candidatus Uabimicrobium sp. HlEnr_7]|uniref:NAD(P)-dependent oxidoreductase n=1 Tax=Candidatus Uabimicrobium helgolandensis TaxID=3095367 RepID=UPI003556F39A